MFSVTFPSLIFSHPAHHFSTVRPSVLVKSRLLSLLSVIACAVKSPPHGPGLQTFCYINHPPRGLHAIKSVLGAKHFTFGGGGWVILKKNILQVHMLKKNFPHKTIVQKKISRTLTIGWKKILARYSQC